MNLATDQNGWSKPSLPGGPARPRIPAGSKVLVFYAGGNGDPHWLSPHAFGDRRKTAGHLSDGSGPHVCASMTIARMEGKPINCALTCRVASVKLAGEPKLCRHDSLRGLAALAVRTGPVP